MYESIPKILSVAINPRTGDVFKPGDMIYRGGTVGLHRKDRKRIQCDEQASTLCLYGEEF